MNPGVREGQKNALDHVEWELQEVVSHSVGAGARSQVLIKQYKAVSIIQLSLHPLNITAIISQKLCIPSCNLSIFRSI